MTKPDGGRLDITLLRPLDWLEELEAKPGSTIELDLEELGGAGPAEVVSIGPCPEVGPRPGPNCRLVTGTFAHQSAEVLDLRIEGLEGPIGVTANHPFWSEDRRAFIPAGQLRPGEHLRTAYGAAVRIAAKALRPGGQTVYNLEVDGEHVYYVSPAGVLVHNICRLDPSIKKPPRANSKYGMITFKSGMKYYGKGPWSRARASARRIQQKHGDTAVKIDWTPARSDRHAFIQEAMRIKRDGGVRNPRNYNQINSPGRRYLP